MGVHGLRILLLASLPAIAGCGSLRYERAWSSFEPSPADRMEGRWKGTWKSDWNGHSGGLRCILSCQEAGRYLAWFHARYARIFSFRYETIFTVAEREPGIIHFEGEQDLGRMAGGVYRYVGTVSGDVFHATYEAENGDHGVFEMQRVE